MFIKYTNFQYMNRYLIIFLLSSFCFSQKKVPFEIDIRPRIIDGGKIIVNISVINNVGRPIDYLEGFISEYSSESIFLGEQRMVLVYNYEPALQTGFSTSKAISYPLIDSNPSNFKFNISKVKFLGESRVFAWHNKSGFIRID